MRGLEDLPAADELRRIPVTRPESLLTADPGLATAPPEQLALAEVEAAPAPRTRRGHSRESILFQRVYSGQEGAQ